MNGDGSQGHADHPSVQAFVKGFPNGNELLNWYWDSSRVTIVNNRTR